MTTPTIPPPLLKRLLALDTPIARRIFETALFGLFMWGCAWAMDSTTVPYGVKIIATFLFVPGLFIGVLLLVSIGMIAMKEFKE